MSLRSILRTWRLFSIDTLELIQGEFEAEDVVENISSAYKEHTSLNRQSPVLQFLHGEADTISFRVRLYGDHFLRTITGDLATLKSWVRKLDGPFQSSRPPILVFSIGNADIYLECVLESIADLRYDRLTLFGNLRGASMTLNLRQYVPFEIGGTYLHETLYHRTRQGEYFELMGWSQYGDPLKGDLLRRRHPKQPDLEAGEVVALPGPKVLATITVQPNSLPFHDSFVNRETPERTLRLDTFDRRNRDYISHLVLED